MILAALLMFSALQTHADRQAIVTVAPQDQSGVIPQSPKAIPTNLATGVKLTIDANGHVQNCVVTSPSRWPALDPALCRILSRMQLEPDEYSKGRSMVRTLDMEWKPPRFW